MAVPAGAAAAAYWIAAAAAVVGTVQSIRVSNAQNRIQEWQAKENARVANVKATEREVDRLKKLRHTLAQNNVQAAASGISLTSGTVEQSKEGSIKQFELDQLTDKTNTVGYVNNLKATAQANSALSSANNLTTALQGVSSVVGNVSAANAPVSAGG